MDKEKAYECSARAVDMFMTANAEDYEAGKDMDGVYRNAFIDEEGELIAIAEFQVGGKTKKEQEESLAENFNKLKQCVKMVKPSLLVTCAEAWKWSDETKKPETQKEVLMFTSVIEGGVLGGAVPIIREGKKIIYDTENTEMFNKVDLFEIGDILN